MSNSVPHAPTPVAFDLTCEDAAPVLYWCRSSIRESFEGHPRKVAPAKFSWKTSAFAEAVCAEGSCAMIAVLGYASLTFARSICVVCSCLPVSHVRSLHHCSFVTARRCSSDACCLSRPGLFLIRFAPLRYTIFEGLGRHLLCWPTDAF